MSAFFITAQQLAILAIMFLVGYYVKKKDCITESAVSGLSFVMLGVCTPATIFASLQIAFSRERLLNGLIMVASFILVMFLGYGLSLVATKLLGITGDEKKIWASGGLMFNALFIGLPITEALYGETAVFYLCFGVVGWNMLSFSFGIQVFASGSKGQSLRVVALRIIKTPAIIACFIGLLFFALQIKVPFFALRSAEYLAGMTVPISMLVSGALMSKSRLRDFLFNKKVYIFSFVRLIVIPLVALAVFSLFLEDKDARNTVVICSAMPVATAASVFAEQFGKCGGEAVKYWCASTVLSLFSLPLISVIISMF